MEFINNLYSDILFRIFKLILLLPVVAFVFSLTAHMLKKSGKIRNLFVSLSGWIVNIPLVKDIADFTPENIDKIIGEIKGWLIGISAAMLFLCFGFVILGTKVKFNDFFYELVVVGVVFFAGIFLFTELVFHRYKTIRKVRGKNLSETIGFSKLFKNYIQNIGVLFSLFMILIPFLVFSSKALPKSSIDTIKVSSTLNYVKSGMYYPHNIFNRSPSPWISGKSGVGEYVDINFIDSFKFDRLRVINGYNDKKLFGKYNRIKKIEIKAGEFKQTLLLKDSRKAQDFSFNRNIKTDKIKLTIVSVYKGTTYNLASLSKLFFFLNGKIVKVENYAKYNLCMIEPKMNHTFYSFGALANKTEVSIDYRGEVITKEWNFGYRKREGTYKIHMETLKKRRVIEKGLKVDEKHIKNLWSAKISFFYRDKTTHQDYIFQESDNGSDNKVLKLNNIYKDRYEFVR
jgi:hypothetical protein